MEDDKAADEHLALEDDPSDDDDDDLGDDDNERPDSDDNDSDHDGGGPAGGEDGGSRGSGRRDDAPAAEPPMPPPLTPPKSQPGSPGLNEPPADPMPAPPAPAAPMPAPPAPPAEDEAPLPIPAAMPAAPRGAPAQDRAIRARNPTDPWGLLAAGDKKFGCFSFTYKERGNSYQASCPWHRLSEDTGCKKTMACGRGPIGQTEEAHRQIIHVLKFWCINALCFDRQCLHRPWTPTADETPPPAIVEASLTSKTISTYNKH